MTWYSVVESWNNEYRSCNRVQPGLYIVNRPQRSDRRPDGSRCAANPQPKFWFLEKIQTGRGTFPLALSSSVINDCKQFLLSLTPSNITSVLWVTLLVLLLFASFSNILLVVLLVLLLLTLCIASSKLLLRMVAGSKVGGLEDWGVLSVGVIRGGRWRFSWRSIIYQPWSGLPADA